MGYTVGQFAGLHQVSKKTLRYYKDIGLLEPAGIDPVNGAGRTRIFKLLQ